MLLVFSTKQCNVESMGHDTAITGTTPEKTLIAATALSFYKHSDNAGHIHLACGFRGAITGQGGCGPQGPGGLQVKDPLLTGRLALQEKPSAVESGSQVTDGRDRGI